MTLEMVNANDRFAERECQRRCDACADQQRARQTRPLRVCDPIEIGQPDVRLRKHALGQRNDAPDMIARREFRHDTPITLVNRDLRMQRMREQAPVRVEYGYTGFVAGGFDAEDAHGSWSANTRLRKFHDSAIVFDSQKLDHPLRN